MQEGMGPQKITASNKQNTYASISRALGPYVAIKFLGVDQQSRLKEVEARKTWSEMKFKFKEMDNLGTLLRSLKRESGIS